MIVKLIASTVVTGWGDMRDAGWVDHIYSDDYPWSRGDDTDLLAEFAGRLCYQSWDRPNPVTATNESYLTNILGKQHFSVLEHASATFYVAEVSRSLSHELVRHRHLSFSQVSQRYVDESKAQVIEPPVFADRGQISTELRIVLSELMNDATTSYQQIMQLIENYGLGMTRKEARQAARSVLPNATETKFVVTGNMRAWRDVIAKRRSPHADEEIRQLANELLRQLKEIAPNTFQDM